jgi:two-component system chemotaxis response regulator CheB
MGVQTASGYTDGREQNGSEIERNRMQTTAGHDIIVVGASAGGIEALTNLVSSLPSNFSASIFVVVHFPANKPSALPRILSRAGPLQAIHPKDGEKIKKGHIYAAPPDWQLLLENGTIRLARGPREHGFRPAIDPLFRSAALSFGSRVVGVVLSGTLDDGSAGLVAIKRHGGYSIVQDPNEALYSGMPVSAIQHDHVDRILPVSEIASTLVELASRPVEKDGDDLMPNETDTEPDIVKKDMETFESGSPSMTSRTVLSCPSCGGVIWELKQGDLIHYRCHVGHAFSEESMFSEQGESLELALWTAVRALEERAALSRRLALRYAERSSKRLENRLLQQAKEAEASANLVRNLLVKTGIPKQIDMDASMETG